jgi:hypothetical protein
MSACVAADASSRSTTMAAVIALKAFIIPQHRSRHAPRYRPMGAG